MNAQEIGTQIIGVRCPVKKPAGAIGGVDHVGVGVGDFVADNGGRGVIVTITDEDAVRRAAIMHLDKAEQLARLLMSSVKRGRRALRKVSS